MFRLKHINNSVKHKILVCLDKEGMPGNYYTVLTGENACGKSSLMSKVVNSFLEMGNAVRLKDIHNQVEEYSSEVPSRIIAFCNSKFDRFMPESVYNKKRLKSTRHSDYDFYIHTGQGAVEHGGIPEIVNSCLSVLWRNEKTERNYDSERVEHAFNMFEMEGELKCNLRVDEGVLKVIIDCFAPEKRNMFNPLSFGIRRLDQARNSNPYKSGLHIMAKVNEYIRSAEMHERVVNFAINYSDRDLKITSFPVLFYSAASRDFDYTFDPEVFDRELIRVLFLIGLIKVSSVDIKRRKESRFISVSALSSGQQTLLSTALVLSGLAIKDCLICIDEPENSLHPQWQLDFMGFISYLCPEELNAHIIVATHSPQIVSGMQFDNGCIVSLKSKNERLRTRNLVSRYSFHNPSFEINSIESHRKQSADKQLMEIFGSPGYKNDFILKKLILILSKQTKNVSLTTLDLRFIQDVTSLTEENRIPDGDPVILLLDQITGFLKGKVNNDY